MEDILLINTLNGTDAIMDNGGFAMTDSIETAVYLALFGGDDWFMNGILSPIEKYNTKTLKALKTNALNSAGRIAIENAVKEDIKPIAQNLQVQPIIQVRLSLDSVEVLIRFEELKFNYSYANGVLTKID